MLLLSDVLSSLLLTTDSASTITTQSNWIDYNTSGASPGSKNTSITTATTTTIVDSPATGDLRQVKSIIVMNTHASVACVITALHDDGTTAARLYRRRLGPGESVEYSDRGWVPYTANGTPIDSDRMVWGGLSGVLEDQTDLQSALDAKQDYNANLSAEAGLTGAADKVSYFTGAGAKALATLTSYGRSIIALADRAGLLSLLSLTTSDIPQDSTHRMHTDAQATAWDAKQAALGYTPENSANKAQANGYASLGSDAKIPTSQLPDSILGALKFKGTWNATTNIITSADSSLNGNPVPAASSANEGYYFMVQVAGSTSEGGITDWKIGDWLLSYGTSWTKIDNTDAVSSVNSKTGTVVLNTDDIAESGTPTNQWFTNARAQAAITLTWLGSLIAGATAKTTPVDADGVIIADSAASSVGKFLSMLNLYSYIKGKLSAAGLVYYATDTWTNLTALSSVPTNAIALCTDMGPHGTPVIYSGSAWNPTQVFIIQDVASDVWDIIFEGASATYARSGTTVTVTKTSHGIPADMNGSRIYISISTGSCVTGWFTNFTYVDANTFTCTDTSSGTTSGNCATNNSKTYIGDSTAIPAWALQQGNTVVRGYQYRVNGANSNAKTITFEYNGLAAVANVAPTNNGGFNGVNASIQMLSSTTYYVGTNTSLTGNGVINTISSNLFKAAVTLAASAGWAAVKANFTQVTWRR